MNNEYIQKIYPKTIANKMQQYNKYFPKGKAKNLSGLTIDKATVLYKTNSKIINNTSYAQWVCLCECGNAFVCKANQIKQDKKVFRCLECSKCDIGNQRFGRLVALNPLDLKLNSTTIWECICDCGNKFK